MYELNSACDSMSRPAWAQTRQNSIMEDWMEEVDTESHS